MVRGRPVVGVPAAHVGSAILGKGMMTPLRGDRPSVPGRSRRSARHVWRDERSARCRWPGGSRCCSLATQPQHVHLGSDTVPPVSQWLCGVMRAASCTRRRSARGVSGLAPEVRSGPTYIGDLDSDSHGRSRRTGHHAAPGGLAPADRVPGVGRCSLHLARAARGSPAAFPGFRVSIVVSITVRSACDTSMTRLPARVATS